MGATLIVAAATAAAQNAAQDYPQWRGKSGDGSASGERTVRRDDGAEVRHRLYFSVNVISIWTVTLDGWPPRAPGFHVHSLSALTAS